MRMEEETEDMMKENKYNKFRRITAIIGIVFLIGMYIVALVAALGKSEKSNALFLVSLYCTFVVPVIIYVLQLVYKLATKGKNDSDSEG